MEEKCNLPHPNTGGPYWTSSFFFEQNFLSEDRTTALSILDPFQRRIYPKGKMGSAPPNSPGGYRQPIWDQFPQGAANLIFGPVALNPHLD